MAALRLAVLALLLYAMTGMAATLIHVAGGGTPAELSRGLIRFAGLLLLAYGLWRRQAWAWWFTVGAGTAAAALGLAALLAGIGSADSVRGEALRTAPALLALLTVLALLHPAARTACGALRPRKAAR